MSGRSSAEHIRSSARTSTDHGLGSSRLSARMSSRMSSTRLSSRLSSRHTSNRPPSGDIAILDTWLAEFVARGPNPAAPKIPPQNSFGWSEADPDTRKRKRNSSLHHSLYGEPMGFSFLDANETSLQPANTPAHCDPTILPGSIRAGASFAGRPAVHEPNQKGRRSASFAGTNPRRVARPDLPVPKMPAAVQPDPDEPPQITKSWTDLERNFSRGRSTEPFGSDHLPAPPQATSGLGQQQHTPTNAILPLPNTAQQPVSPQFRDQMRQMSIQPPAMDLGSAPIPHQQRDPPETRPSAQTVDPTTDFGFRQTSAPSSAQRPTTPLNVFSSDPLALPQEQTRTFLLPPSEAARRNNVSLAPPPHLSGSRGGPDPDAHDEAASFDLFVESLGQVTQPTQYFSQQHSRKISADIGHSPAQSDMDSRTGDPFSELGRSGVVRTSAPSDGSSARMSDKMNGINMTGRVISAPIPTNGFSDPVPLRGPSPNFGPGSSRKSKAKRYKSLEPSRHCHVCSRPDDSVQVMSCSNLFNGTCRKIVCEKCFERYQWDFAATKERHLEWSCTHCRNVCPEKACCKKYERTNLARHWKAKMRKTSNPALPKN